MCGGVAPLFRSRFIANIGKNGGALVRKVRTLPPSALNVLFLHDAADEGNATCSGSDIMQDSVLPFVARVAGEHIDSSGDERKTSLLSSVCIITHSQLCVAEQGNAQNRVFEDCLVIEVLLHRVATRVFLRENVRAAFEALPC